MDKDLLLKIFSIPNSTGNEDGMSSFIQGFFDNLGIKYKIDFYGNIYNLEDKNLPILNAHMDSVQDQVDEALCHLTKIRNGILSGYGNIAGDDKCGIFIILEILKRRKVNFIFTREEEIGCVGINKFLERKTIKHFPYALTLDRFGSSDIICEKNDYGTKEFEQALLSYGNNYGYKAASGVYSDADYISEEISCANISVGYYGHHSKNEYVNLKDLQNSINFVEDVVTNLRKKFEAPEKFQRFPAAYMYGNDYEYIYEDEGYIHSDKCFVTGKECKNLVYIPSLDGFVSPKGAKILFEDLEQSGFLYGFEDDEEFEDFNDEDMSENEIDALLKDIV